MNASGVQTSVQELEPDLFGPPPEPEPSNALLLQVRGVLLESAVVTTRQAANGGLQSVLCVDIQPLSGAALSLHAEISLGATGQAEAIANASPFCKGARVVITTPPVGIRRDLLPAAHSVTLLPSSKASQ